jgi:hypothetical protein
MVPEHQRLNSTPNEAGHYANPSKALKLQSTDTFKEGPKFLYLPHGQGVLFPVIYSHWGRIAMNSKRRKHVFGVKPLKLPIPHRIKKSIIKELRFFALPELNPSPTKDMRLCRTRLGFQTEEIAK